MSVSVRQEQIIRLVADGLTRKEIAEELDLSVSTVRDIIRLLCDRFGCAQRELPERVDLSATAE